MPTDQDINFSNRQRFHILFSLMFGIIMAPIDASMVNVILPTLTEVFSADIALAQWVPMIYLLIISSLLLFFGRLGDIWGYKRIFMCGLGCFVIASGLCGLSPSIHWLIAFRAVQGVGASMMMAVPLATASLTSAGRHVRARWKKLCARSRALYAAVPSGLDS